MTTTLRLAAGLVSMLTLLGPAAAIADSTWHYTGSSNMLNGVYAPGALGFNLADISTLGNLNRLPDNAKGLVYISSSVGCAGNTQAFRDAIEPYRNNPKLWGFYLYDEPYIKGYGGKPPCPQANFKAETDYVRANFPGVKTYVKLGNAGTTARPDYKDYTPANTGIDVLGIGGYLCRSTYVGKPGMEDGCDPTLIPRYTTEALRWIPRENMAPTYQAFGGWRTEEGGVFLLPTPEQERRLLAQWEAILPHPPMEFAYNYGCQEQSTGCISSSPALQAVFKEWNERVSTPAPEPEPPKPEEPGTGPCQCICCPAP